MNALSPEEYSVVLTSLYDKVHEPPDVLLNYIAALFDCERAYCVAFTPRERFRLHQHSLVAQAESWPNKGSLSPVDREQLLYIGGAGDRNLYVCLRFRTLSIRLQQSDRTLFNRLLGHVRQALHLSLRMRQMQTVSNTLRYTLDRYPLPVLALDSDWRLVFANSAVDRLQYGPIHQGKHAVVTVSSHAEAPVKWLTRDLRKQIYQALNGPGSHGSVFLRVTVERTPYVCWVSRFMPTLDGEEINTATYTWLCLLDEKAVVDLRSNQRFRSLGLSTAESRLVEALMQGASVEDVASIRGVSVLTIRKQLKAVFKKMGCDSQESLLTTLFERVIRYGLAN